MLEDFQEFHAADKEEARDWAECNAFLFAVPIAYTVAIAVAVAVALAI